MKKVENIALDTKIDASMKAIEKNYNSFVRQYHEIEHDLTENEIHDKRVVLRRVFPILKACKINPAKVKNGKTAFELFGKLRDIQVQILKLENSDRNPEIERYLVFLKDNELKIKEKVQKFTKKKKVVFPLLKKAKIDKAKLKAKAEKAAMKLVEKALSQPIDDADDVHKIRIEFKKFRYLVEMLSYIETIEKEKIETIKTYQDVLGEIQDYEVLIQGIRKFYKKRRLAEDVDTEAFEMEQNLLIENFDNELETFIFACKDVVGLNTD